MNKMIKVCILHRRGIKNQSKSTKIDSKFIQNLFKNGFKIDLKMVWFRVCLGVCKSMILRSFFGGPPCNKKTSKITRVGGTWIGM